MCHLFPIYLDWDFFPCGRRANSRYALGYYCGDTSTSHRLVKEHLLPIPANLIYVRSIDRYLEGMERAEEILLRNSPVGGDKPGTSGGMSFGVYNSVSAFAIDYHGKGDQVFVSSRGASRLSASDCKPQACSSLRSSAELVHV